MIATPHNLPYVSWSEDRPIPLSEGWILESISQAVHQAGNADWNFGEDIAKAICYYLKRDFQHTLISVQDVNFLIRQSLQGVGCPDIAFHAALIAPRVNIYLPDIAMESPYELQFFSSLGERLREAIRVVVRGVKLEGLRPCVKIIESRKKWMPNCEVLSDEIVSFSRKYLAAHPDNLELVIA
jgi:hypothetical protein